METTLPRAPPTLTPSAVLLRRNVAARCMALRNTEKQCFGLDNSAIVVLLWRFRDITKHTRRGTQP